MSSFHMKISQSAEKSVGFEGEREKVCYALNTDSNHHL